MILVLTACNGKDSLSKDAEAAINGECNDFYFSIKGNQNSKGEWIYHMKGQRYYTKTFAEECFAYETTAQAAGYRKAKV